MFSVMYAYIFSDSNFYRTGYITNTYGKKWWFECYGALQKLV